MQKAFTFKIWGENQNFKTRLKSAKEEGRPEVWIDIFEKIYALGEIILANKEMLTPEELNEYIRFYEMAAIVHNPFGDKEAKKQTLEVMTKLFNDNIERYAFLLNMSKKTLLSNMELERNKLYGLETVGKKTTVKATVVGKELNLPPVKAQELTLPFEFDKPEPIPQEMETLIIQHPAFSTEQSRFRASSKKRIEEESNLKFSITRMLQNAYLNLEEFKGYYDRIQNPYLLKDVRNTKEPTKKQSKVTEMKKHLRLMEAYYNSIINTYNGCYNAVSEIQSGRDTATLEEFRNLHNIVKIVERLTEALNAAVGARKVNVYNDYKNAYEIPVTEYIYRRRAIYALIEAYNAELADLFKEKEQTSSSKFKLS